jgi:hypothetical protein
MTVRKKLCVKCPFRRDVEPYLHPRRAADIAYASQNQYNDFTCHETLGHDDEGETIVTEKSLTCAGFYAMQVNYCVVPSDDYEWPGDVYSEPGEMADAYQEAWDQKMER